MASVSNSSFSVLEDKIYTAFAACSVGSGFFLNQNGVEPQTPYCSIFLIDETPSGFAQESTIVKGTDRSTYVSQPYQATVRFTFVGKDMQNGGTSTTAANNADDFRLKLQSRKYRMLFSDNGLSILRVSPLRRTNQKRETDIYSVYSIDVTLSYDRHMKMTFETIDHGEINGTFTQANNSEVNTTINF